MHFKNFFLRKIIVCAIKFHNKFLIILYCLYKQIQLCACYQFKNGLYISNSLCRLSNECRGGV